MRETNSVLRESEQKKPGCSPVACYCFFEGGNCITLF